MIKTHISLNVSDLSRSLEFYSAFFGAPPHKARPGYANFDLEEPPLKFALVENPERARQAGRLDHLGFLVPDAETLEGIKARLKDAGLATFDETDTVCCYAKQDKVWAHDPDGNEWEVYVLLDDLLDDETGGDSLSGEAQPLIFNLIPAHRCCEETLPG